MLLLFLASEILKQCAPNVSDIYIFQQMNYQVGSKVIPATVLVTILGALSGMPGSIIKFWATKITAHVGGMKRVMLIAVFSSLAVRVLQFAVGIKTLPRLVLVYLIDVIQGLPNGITNIAMRTMISDSVEYVEWKTGERTEGITMSVRNLMSKISSAIQKLIQGYCLDFLQFDPKLVERNLPQGAHFHKWVWPMFKLGPAVGLALSLIPLLLLKYPDSLKRQVEDEIAQRRVGTETEERV